MATRADTQVSPKEGLTLIGRVLDALHVSLAVGDSLIPDGHVFAGADAALLIATARFLQETAAADTPLRETLLAMLQGYVLKDTLLLADIAVAARRFKGLRVIADSQILFGAVGLRGPAAQTASLELIRLLRSTGAHVEALEPTVREMGGILAVYEDRVRTSQGRESLYRTELTRHILSQRLSPSDIRIRAATLRDELVKLGINVKEPPERARTWTWDERKLGEMLSDRPGGESQARVVHDVDCVAAVLTYRRGRTSSSLDEMGTVFVTTSPMTVQNTVAWYRDEGGVGLPPIVHYIALSNAAWLKNPGSAADLQMHELIALCSAALSPSREAWSTFVGHVRKLRESGALSSDEVTALIVSELTDRLLVDEAIDEDSDAASLSEVVERVKASYGAVAQAEVADARRVAAERSAEADAVRAHVAGRARAIGASVATLIAVVLAAMFGGGTIASIVEAATGTVPPISLIILAIIPLAIAGLCSLLWGFSVHEWQRSAEAGISALAERWLLGNVQSTQAAKPSESERESSSH